MAALAQEVARSTDEVKASLPQGLEEILSARGEYRKEAIGQQRCSVASYWLVPSRIRDSRMKSSEASDKSSDDHSRRQSRDVGRAPRSRARRRPSRRRNDANP
jgi:hypothetical protein